MATQDSKISTFIPNRNHQKYLRQSAQSVLSQSLLPFELFLIDDASVDGSADEMEELARTYKGPVKVKVRTRTYHAGHIATYNKGILACTGEYVHLMAADDRLIDPSFYEKAQEILTDPEIGMVFGGLVIADEYGQQNGKEIKPPLAGKQSSKTWLEEMAKHGNFICGGAVIVRRELQKEVGGYDDRFPFSADWINWMRILGICKSAFSLAGTVYEYRRHRAQMTHKTGASPEERARGYSVLSEQLRKVA